MEKINRKDHLLETVSNKYPSDSHLAKTVFRLTVPLIAKLLHIDTKLKMYLLQALAGFLFFIIINNCIYQISLDKTISILDHNRVEVWLVIIIVLKKKRIFVKTKKFYILLLII